MSTYGGFSVRTCCSVKSMPRVKQLRVPRIYNISDKHVEVIQQVTGSQLTSTLTCCSSPKTIELSFHLR